MIILSTLHQLQFARGYTLSRLKQVHNKNWDTQPEGYSNTIRWNVGHIFVTTEYFIQKAVPAYEIAHAEWQPLFAAGTNAEGLQDKAPSSEELLTALKEQSGRLQQTLEGKLHESLHEPIAIRDLISMETVDAVVQFVTWHEGVHAGFIDALNRAI